MTRALALKADDKVLLGRPGITLPGEWWTGVVIWTDGADVVVEQDGPVGTRRHKRLCEIGEIRAVSRARGWGHLQGFKAEAMRAVQEQVDEVEACEARLGRARKEVWTRLDVIGSAIPRLVDRGG